MGGTEGGCKVETSRRSVSMVLSPSPTLPHQGGGTNCLKFISPYIATATGLNYR